MFKVKNVVVQVNSLEFHIRDSKHDVLYNTLRPVSSTLTDNSLVFVIAWQTRRLTMTLTTCKFFSRYVHAALYFVRTLN